VSYDLWKFLHILLFVYWLGADLGVFLLARTAKRPDLSFDQRALLLKMALLIDLTPRIAFVLMFPVGLHLAIGLGLISAGPLLVTVIWLLAGAWLALLLSIGRHEGTPLGAALAQWNLRLQALLGALIIGVGAASLLGYGPFRTVWLGLKVLLFGLIFVCSIMIDVRFRPLMPAFARLAVEGSRPDIERDISGAIDGAIRWVLALYALVVVIAFLGTVKPV
jgi:hypothetical protein